MYISREIESDILKAIENSPVVAIIGPRQCGKSTLVNFLLNNYHGSVYLDMERPSDLQKMQDAEWFLDSQKGKLLCIDEIQRKPELFPILRSLVDEYGTNSCYLILGSASRDLLQQSSETLAGRIFYKRLTPFLWKEIKDKFNIERYFSQGAFPRSLLVSDTDISYEWRENFISTFLERDLLFWKSFSPVTMRRLWQMLAHINGQTLDYARLSNSLGVSAPTVKNYIDLLESTFMLEVIPAYHSNMKKRLVKSPKVYISDSGITATLLGVRSFAEISGHPAFGSIWEQIVLSNLKGLFPEAIFFYYRTSNGAEVDFVMKIRNIVVAIECKSTLSPKLTKGNYNAVEDISADKILIVSPIKKGYPMKPGIDVVSLLEMEGEIRELMINYSKRS